MNKLIAWIAGMTKVGQAVKKVQDFLDGKKQYLAGAGMAFPALITIIQKFQEGGIQYLLGATHSPEYLALTAGVAIIANAAKGQKIRQENAEIMAKLEDKQAATTPPAPPAQ